MLDHSDCIAMSEDGDWFAYPKGLTRGEVMAAVARGADGVESWPETLRRFKVRAGWVHETINDWGEPWWQACAERAPGATPCWLVTPR